MNIYLVTTSLPDSYDCARAFVVQAIDSVEAAEMTLTRWGDHNPYIKGTIRCQKLGVVTADLPQVQKIVVRSWLAG